MDTRLNKRYIHVREELCLYLMLIIMYGKVGKKKL